MPPPPHPPARFAPPPGSAEYTLSADVYSTGLLLWAIARRSYPFPDLHSTAELMRAVKGGVRPARPETAPPGWADLVELCWDDDPARRPEVARVHDILHAIPVDRLPSDDT